MSENINTNPRFNIPFLDKQKGDPDIKFLILRYLYLWPLLLVCALIGYSLGYIKEKLEVKRYRIETTMLTSINSSQDPIESLFSNQTRGQRMTVQDEMGLLKSFSLAEATVKKLNINVSYYIKKFDWFSEDFEWFFPNRQEVYKNNRVFVEIDKTKPILVGGLFRLKTLSDTTFNLIVERQGFSLYNPKTPNVREYFGNIKLEKEVFKFDEVISIFGFDFAVKRISAQKGDELFFNLIDDTSLAKRFSSLLGVDQKDGRSGILRIAIETPFPEVGENYLNTLIETHLERELNKKNKQSENIVRFITSQLSGISDSLQTSEGELQQYRSQNKIVNLSQEGSVIFDNLQVLEQQKSQFDIKLDYYNSFLDRLDSDDISNLVSPSMAGIDDPILGVLIDNLSQLGIDRERLLSNFTEQTPAVRDINSRIASTKQSLISTIRTSISTTQRQIDRINDQIRQVESEISSLPQTERDLIGIQRKFSINENIYLYLMQRKSEAEILLASNIPTNSVVDRANNVGQVSPVPNQYRKIFTFFGLLIPITFIAIKEFMSNKIIDPKRLEGQLNVPLISIIGRSEEEDALPVLVNPQSTVTESFRSLRADISYLSDNKDNLTMLFTSTISGEGKTFLAMNLASIYSLMGKKTLLLGLDLRKPKIAKEFGLTNDIGISTILSSKVTWKEALKSSGHANFDIILSGPIPPNPAELLLTNKFVETLEDLKKEYEIIIFDCPPVGLVSETKELFRLADLNFFVFRQGFSEKASTEFLNNLVEKGGVKKIYGILNDMHIEKGYSYGAKYGYGYGKNYKGYYTEDNESSRWKRWIKRNNK